MVRGRRQTLEEQGKDLNLIPYLDIMVNLVLFMLVTITSFLSFTILNASIPQLSPDSGKAAEAMKKEQLLLMVRVDDKGIAVDPNVQGGQALPRTLLPKKPDGFDYAGLQLTAQKIKERFPEESRVLIIADPKIIYDDIIRTMDAMRERKAGDGDLFPDVTLSIL